MPHRKGLLTGVPPRVCFSCLGGGPLCQHPAVRKSTLRGQQKGPTAEVKARFKAFLFVFSVLTKLLVPLSDPRSAACKTTEPLCHVCLLLSGNDKCVSASLPLQRHPQLRGG